MLLKTKKTLICVLIFICVILLSAAALCFALETQPVRAATTPEGTALTGGGIMRNDGYYYLADDLTITTDLELEWSDVTIDLNGHKLTLGKNSYGISARIAVPAGSTLTLKDFDAASTNYITDPQTNESCEIRGGVITGGGIGGVSLHGGTFNMEGGTIAGNTAGQNNGGGVSLVNGSTFNMSGGTISHNSAYAGGGVYVDEGTFNMSGGTIEKNWSTNNLGGGVYVYFNGAFNVSGAVNITENTGIGDSNKLWTHNVIFVGSTDCINIVGKLEDENGNRAKVGIYNQRVFTSGYRTYNGGVAPHMYFLGDTETCIVLNEDEAENTHIMHNISLSTGKCSRCGLQYAAQVNNNYYSSFEEAFTYAINNSSATVKMFVDVTISNYIKVDEGKDITLDLNGRKLALKENASGSVISVSGTFTLTDTYIGADRKHNVNGTEIIGGVITGGKGSGENKLGGGIYVTDDATFNMKGGTIAGNIANYGGGVRVNTGATFVMEGGSISHNVAVNDAGGLCVYLANKIELKDGNISYNSAANGGAIYFEGEGLNLTGAIEQDNYILNGVNIFGNTATDNGGAIYIDGSTVTMNGGAVGGDGTFKNSVTGESGKGGGVYIANTLNEYNRDKAYAQFTMTGGSIIGNTAKNGGGVYMNCLKGGFIMSGGTITNNTSSSFGGGVYVWNGTFGVSGAVNIIGNKYGDGAQRDSNVHVGAGSLISVAGKLEDGSNNKAQIGFSKSVGSQVTTGYGANNKDGGGNEVPPNRYFISDTSSSCVYLNENEAYFGEHTGGTATCTAQKICSVCGEGYGDFAAHDFKSGTTYKSDGTQHWKVCANCTAEDTEHKTNHSYGGWETTLAPTCSEVGSKKHSCTVCRHEETQEMPSLGHDWGGIGVPPAWNWNGYTEATATFKCQNEGCSEVHSITVYSSGQGFYDKITANTQNEATCVSTGLIQYVAGVEFSGRVCYGYKYEVTPIKAHSYGEWNEEIPATCTQSGTTGYYVCSECGLNYNKNNNVIGNLTIAALGHDFASEFTVDTVATCTVKGSQSKHCSRCDEKSEITEIPLAAHTEEIIPAVAPTCTEAGKTEGKKCSVCAAIISAQAEIAAIGHNYGDWELFKAATIAEFGEERRVCAHDSAHYESRQLPKLVAELVKPDENGGENQVVVTTPNGFTHDIELIVTEIARENYFAYENIAQTVNGEINLVYDVTLKSDGVTIQPDGTLTIKLHIPENLQGKKFKLFHLHGSDSIDMQYAVDGNYAVVTVDRLSEFIFVGEKAAAPNGFNPLWLILIIIVALAIVGEVVYIVYRKTRKNKAAEGKK